MYGPASDPAHGPAERQLLRSGRLYATLARAVLALATQAIALLVVPGATPLVVLVLSLTWSAVLTRRLRRPGTPGLLAADTALVAALGLAQPWIDSPALIGESSGWVQMVVVTTVVAHQWQFPEVPAAGTAAAAVVLVVAFGAGASRAVGPDLPAVLMPAVWIFLTGGISRILGRTVRQAARRVDDASAALERDQARAAVAAARRVGEQEHLAALHDTAAATLMMVGLGTVGPDEPWLREQAGRDLRALRDLPGRAFPTDLGAALRLTAEQSGVRVGITGDGDRVLPSDAVAALAGAVAEALRNVRRHAGVGEAELSIGLGIGARDGVTRVEVRDRGRGFPTSLMVGGRGVRESIVGRMERAGGLGRVTPMSPGTLVELEWPRE